MREGAVRAVLARVIGHGEDGVGREKGLADGVQRHLVFAGTLAEGHMVEVIIAGKLAEGEGEAAGVVGGGQEAGVAQPAFEAADFSADCGDGAAIGAGEGAERYAVGKVLLKQVAVPRRKRGGAEEEGIDIRAGGLAGLVEVVDAADLAAAGGAGG